jgi:hypothetical protein
MAEMIADWRETVRRISDGFDLEWPIERHEAVHEIGPLLKRRLCHSAAAEPPQEKTLHFSAATWAAVERGLAGDEPAARAGFDAVREALHDLDRMYEPYLSALIALGKPRRLTAPWRALRRMLRGG